MLAHKGEAKVAIEIQWSPQNNEKSLYRQERYRQSDVRCLWLLRRPGFPVSQDFPAARVSGDLAEGFEAHLDGQVMPLDVFLDAVFAKRFRYGIPVGAKAIVRVHGWRSYFGRKVTRDIGHIDVLVGPHRIQLTVQRLEIFPDLLASCKERIPKVIGTGLNTPGHKLDITDGILAEFQITLSERWMKAIKTAASINGWGVFAFE